MLALSVTIARLLGAALRMLCVFIRANISHPAGHTRCVNEACKKRQAQK